MNDLDDVALAQQSWAFLNLSGRDREWTPIKTPRTVTASGNVNPLDDVVRVDATAGAVTMTLETAVGCDGRQHTFKKIDSGSNAMTIDGLGSETIDGSSTVSTTVQGIAFWLKSNGVGWDSVILAPGTAAGGAGTVTSVALTAPNNDVLVVSGSPVTTAGTLVLTPADPNADRIVFWDDSAGKWVYLTVGTNLTITGTTLDASGGGPNYQWLQFAISDQASVITTGTAKFTTRFPACTVLAVRASLKTASASGTPTVDINESGTTILSTKLTIDATELTSTTAAAAAVISDSTIADDAEITFDIDVAGTAAVGLIVSMKVQWT